MSVALMKTLMYGKNFSLHAPADVFFLYEKWKTSIQADEFHPLIPITGGMSVIIGQDENNRSLQAIMFGEDWLHKCNAIGVGTKNALICLASNFDDQMGMAALALELAMISHKPKTHESVKIDTQTYVEIVSEIFAKDYAGVRSMAEKWGIGFKGGFQPEPPKKTRSDWRKEIGHDVLIHPATLEPCKYGDGSVLEYKGVIYDEVTDRSAFRFVYLTTNEEIMSDTFLSTSVS